MPKVTKRWMGYNDQPCPINAEVSGQFQTMADLVWFLRAVADRLDGNVPIDDELTSVNMPFHYDVQHDRVDLPDMRFPVTPTT